MHPAVNLNFQPLSTLTPNPALSPTFPSPSTPSLQVREPALLNASKENRFPPLTPAPLSLEPEEVAHVITELQQAGTGAGAAATMTEERRRALLTLLGIDPSSLDQ
ncbi:hypothetical protein IAT40_007493 [Kwoniella sp. CBS 6097]